MAFWDRLFGRQVSSEPAPRAAVQDAGPGRLVRTAADLEDAMRGVGETRSGAVVTATSAMKVATVYACVRIISGAVATLPLHIKRRVDAKTREDASDTELWKVIRRRPNRWQKPAQFRRMMQAHVLLRGNAYAVITRTTKRDIKELIPLHPDRVEAKQLDDMSMQYIWTRKDGRKIVFRQDEVLHLFGLTLDGVNGVTPITFARETIGLAMSMEDHGAATFKNGARIGGALKHPGKLGGEGVENLRASLEDFRAGGSREGKFLILEEGMDVAELSMTSKDAEWLEGRKFSRTDIAMFFGVPPHMFGDTEKSTSWGTGIEQQTQGFLAFTLEDHLVMWEEGITVDLTEDGSDLYAKFNRNALVRADLKTRTDHYTKMLQWGVYNPDKVLELEDENPREDGKGGVYYDPPNTAGTPSSDQKDNADDPAQSA